MTDTYTDASTSETTAGVTTTTYTRTYLHTDDLAWVVVYGDLAKKISVTPVSVVPDRPALSARLKSTDQVLIRFTTPTYFSDFTQTDKSMLFTIGDDGYVEGDLSGVPAAIASILATASTYSVTSLAYNMEWPLHTIEQKVTRLAAIRAELDLQGNTRPVIFGPIFGDFYSHYDDFSPYCEGYGVQLQNVLAGTEATWAADCVAKAESVMVNPIMSMQISCLGSNRTLEQIIEAAMDVGAVSGVTSVGVFTAAPYWTLCDSVLTLIRP